MTTYNSFLVNYYSLSLINRKNRYPRYHCHKYLPIIQVLPYSGVTLYNMENTVCTGEEKEEQEFCCTQMYEKCIRNNSLIDHTYTAEKKIIKC